MDSSKALHKDYDWAEKWVAKLVVSKAVRWAEMRAAGWEDMSVHHLVGSWAAQMDNSKALHKDYSWAEKWVAKLVVWKAVRWAEMRAADWEDMSVHHSDGS